MPLTDDQRTDLRAYVARRVPELSRENFRRGSSQDEATQAKGEWMLAEYARLGSRVGAALLEEVIADTYGVRR